MNCTADAPSVLFANASSDIQNVVYFKLHGLKVDERAYELDENAMATMQVDQQQGVCLGRNSGESVCSATAILFDQAPTRIELGANSVYSSVYPHVRYVTLGTAEIVNSQWAPRGSARRDITPQVWVVPAESAAAGP